MCVCVCLLGWVGGVGWGGGEEGGGEKGPRPFDQKGPFSGFSNSSFTLKLNFKIVTK